jgi:hypothetical protein
MTRPFAVTTGVADTSPAAAKLQACTRLPAFVVEIVVSTPFLELLTPLPQFAHVVAVVGGPCSRLLATDFWASQLPVTFQPFAPKHTALIFKATSALQEVEQESLLAQLAGHEAPFTAGKGPQILVLALPGSAACEEAALIKITAMVSSMAVIRATMLAMG